MVDTGDDGGSCRNCGRGSRTDGVQTDLKRCYRCRVTRYCSRSCQKEDWNYHKYTCVINAATSAVSGATSQQLNTTASLGTAAIDMPFHRLHDKTWLHDRREKDVYKLLIDTYRLRMGDMYKIEGTVDRDSVYGGAHDAMPGFRRFLDLVESKDALLPSWWSSEKREACEGLGMQPGWSSLRKKAEKQDVIEHYEMPLMPLQLRLFGAQIYGRAPGGADGTMVMLAQMSAERGNGFVTTIDVDAMMRD